MENIQTDCARLSEKVDGISKQSSAANLQRGSSKSPKIDLASEEMSNWVTTKISAAFDTPDFNKKVKGIFHNKMQTNTISVANISESAKYSIKNWAVDAVVDKIEEICECNSDTIVKALKKDLQANVAVSSSGASGDKLYKETVQQALKLIQDQLNEHKTDIQGFSSNTMKSNVAALMSILTVKSIFSDFSTAATKVLENLKIWSHLEPARNDDCTKAARNLLDFQSSKGNSIFRSDL